MELTIIVPTYNSSRYLQECLSSLAMNSVKDFEVIVVDGGSSDDTEKIVASYVNRYPNFSFFQLSGSLIIDRLLFAINKMHGEWVAVCDSDDFVKPNLYSFLLSKAAQEKCDFCACNSFSTGPMHNILISEGVYCESEVREKILVNSDANCAYWGGTWHTFIARPAFFMKNRALLAGTTNPFCDVVYFYTALLSSTRAYISNERLYFYRPNVQSSTRTMPLTSLEKGLDTYKRLQFVFSSFNVSKFFPSTHHILYSIVTSVIKSAVITQTKTVALQEIRALVSDQFVHSCFKDGFFKNNPFSSHYERVINFLIKKKKTRLLYFIYHLKSRKR